MTIVMRGLGISPGGAVVVVDPAFVPAVVSAEELVPMTVGAVELVPSPHSAEMTAEHIGFGPGCIKFNAAEWIDYTGSALTALVDKGCVRLRYRPDYTGVPSAPALWWSSDGGGPWLANLILFGHADAGGGGFLIAAVLAADASTILQIGAPFSAVSGQWYDFEFGWDCTVGSGWGGEMWLNGSLHASDAGTGVRSNETDRWTIGSNEVIGYGLDEIVAYDQAQHRSPFTPPTGPLESPYADDVLLVGHFDDVSGQSFDWDYVRDGGTPGQSVSGSPEIETISDLIDTSLIPEARGAPELVPSPHGAPELVPSPHSAKRID